MSIDITYKYDGWVYHPYEDKERDEEGRVENVKIYHEVITPHDDHVSINFDPYRYLTAEQFVEWVRRGKITGEGMFIN